MSIKRYYRYLSENNVPMPLRRFLMERHGYSSRLLTRIKTEGAVTLNGKSCRFSDQTVFGDQVEVILPEETVNMMPVYSPVDILYEDDQILVVNKNAGTVTHPTKRHQEDTLGNFMAYYLRSQGDHAKIRFVNRLDMDTTGTVVVAKNKYVHHYVQSAFAGKAEKTYMAFVHGVPRHRRGKIDVPILRDAADDIMRRVDEQGKPCVTHYEVVQDYGQAALLRIRLETGRTHQIRVHMQYMGHPIIGDPMYGDPSKPDFGMSRQALHASDMILWTPDKGRMHFRAGFKDDMLVLWQHLLLLR